MSAVIKSGGVESRPVLPLNTALAIPKTASAPTAEAVRQSVLEDALAAALTGQAERDARIQQLERAEREAHARGMAEGRRLGAAEADKRTDELLSRLTETGHQAGKGLQDGISGLERAVIELTNIALSRIVADADHRSSLVVDTVKRASSILFADATAVVEVSPHDFSEQDIIHAFTSDRSAPFDVRLNSGLSSGGCQVKLALGMLDLSLDHQIHALRSLLEEYAEARA